jgi:uncharacterized protein (TIGR02284 family)
MRCFPGRKLDLLVGWKTVKKSNVISALNDVIAACKDREDCFLFCVERASEDQDDLRCLLVDGRIACALAANELQNLVRAQGGEPETSVSLAGAFHRNWLDIKTAVTGFDRTAILRECDEAAELASRAYRRAMERDLSPRIRTVLERQYQDMLRDREKFSNLLTIGNEARSMRSY